MNKVLNMLQVTLKVVLVIGFIFFEELIWDRIVQPIRRWINSFEFFQKMQAKIEVQGVYTILSIFIVLFVIVELMGLWATALFLTGSILTGVVVYALKIPLAGFVFWMFSFTKPKLLTVDWFKTLYDLVMRLFTWIKSTRIYRKVIYSVYLTKRYIRNASAGSFKEDMTRIYQDLKRVFKDKSETPVRADGVEGATGVEGADGIKRA